MKKSFIPLLVLTISGLAGLSGCKPDNSTSGIASVPPVSVPVVNSTIKDVLAANYEGALGKYNKANKAYDLKLKSTATKENVVVSGTYMSSGDGSYNHSGYLVDETGAIIYLHVIDASMTNADTEITAGVKIKATGKLDAYHGFPQIGAGWTYEVVEAAPADVTSLYGEYTEVSVEDLYDTDGQMKSEYAMKPVLVKNMVMTSDLMPAGSTNFKSLAKIDDGGAKSIAVYHFKTSNKTDYFSGGLYDIYGYVTGYEGVPQFNVNKIDSNEKFVSVKKLEPGDLTDSQLLATQFLFTGLGSISSEAELDYRGGTPEPVKATLKATNTTKARATYSVTGASADYNDWAEVKTDEIGVKSLVFKTQTKGSTWKSTGIVKLTHRVCVGAAAVSDEECNKTVDKTLYKEEKKNITVTHIFEDPVAIEGPLSGTFNKSVPENFEYITNNATYPNPSYDSTSGAIKLAYAESGFKTTLPIIGGKNVTLTLNAKIDKYNPKGETPEDNERVSKIAVQLLDEQSKILKTITTDNLFNASNLDFRDLKIDLAVDSGSIAYANVIVDTSTYATLYVKTATLAKAVTPPVGPGSGSAPANA